MDLALWQIMVLAVLQGTTEFLPVSSSGHLVIAAAFMSPDGSTQGLEIPDLNIVLHGGTLLSIVVFYFRRILRLLVEDRRTLILLAAGTLPAVVVGVPLKLFVGDAVLANPILAGCLLPITGLVLLLMRAPGDNAVAYQQFPLSKAVLVGMSQAVAILPGLSRSGATITTASRLGMSPDSAATFSFLLAIPTIGGACVLELVGGFGKEGLQTPVEHLLMGAGVAFVVGLMSLSWLLRWIELGRLHYFAWWCIPLGIAVVTWQLVR